MKYCGIELKSNEARIVSIDFSGSDYELIALEMKKIKLNDPKSQEACRLFLSEFNDFLATMNFDKIAIKERGKKGKFAGGAISFKMEGLIQSLHFPIETIHIATVKSKIKGLELKTEGINIYQEEALKVALSLSK